MTSTPDPVSPTASRDAVPERPPGGTVRVLHVDDEPDFADLVSRFLEREDDRFEVETATSTAAGLETLEAARFDCVVSDYDMPDADGIEFLEVVRERNPDLPFILYTGKGSEEVASEAISAGVTDYLQKVAGTGQYAVLANRIGNVVERHRTRQELAASRERLAMFFEQSPLGVIEWDGGFRVARVNEAAQEILGYDEEELVGASWERIVPEGDRETVSGVVKALLADEGGFHSVNENVRGDGERIVCEWHNRVVTDDDGDVVAIFSQFLDVTDRERQEAAVKAREERFRAIAESASDAIVSIDTDSVIRYANPAVEVIFGYDPHDLLGEPLTTLIPERNRDRHLTAFERYLGTGERTLDWENIELTGRHRDGHDLDLRVSFSEIVGDDRHRFTGIIRDVTDEE